MALKDKITITVVGLTTTQITRLKKGCAPFVNLSVGQTWEDVTTSMVEEKFANTIKNWCISSEEKEAADAVNHTDMDA